MFKEFKEKVNSKVEEIKTKKEESEMNEEKKGMPKWLKRTLIGAGAAGVAVGAYVLGKHNGNSDDSDFVDEFQDAMIDAAEDDADIESEEF